MEMMLQGCATQMAEENKALTFRKCSVCEDTILGQCLECIGRVQWFSLRLVSSWKGTTSVRRIHGGGLAPLHAQVYWLSPYPKWGIGHQIIIITPP